MNTDSPKRKTPNQKISFEQKMERLKEITLMLESSELSLNESVKCFEEGVKLSKECHSVLNDAEKKVEILIKENGEVIGKKELEEI